MPWRHKSRPEKARSAFNIRSAEQRIGHQSLQISYESFLNASTRGACRVTHKANGNLGLFREMIDFTAERLKEFEAPGPDRSRSQRALAGSLRRLS